MYSANIAIACAIILAMRSPFSWLAGCANSGMYVTGITKYTFKEAVGTEPAVPTGKAASGGLLARGAGVWAGLLALSAVESFQTFLTNSGTVVTGVFFTIYAFCFRCKYKKMLSAH